ncbi:MAG: peptidase, partial [Planctomycetaceae bacterium]|nr:peptidase [Planctomycetaceae bacterium]
MIQIGSKAMLLGQCGTTPFDWNFTLFGFRVRVHPFFWVLSIFFSYRFSDDLPPHTNLMLTAIGVACVFVSILIHELGHAFLIRYEGFVPEIVLHAFGGYAQYQPYRAIHPRMKMLISFAGPAAGFLFYALICAAEELFLQYGPANPHFLIRYAFYELKFINLWWGLINLLPIYPLDGGQIARVWMQTRWGFGGLAYSLFVSII